MNKKTLLTVMLMTCGFGVSQAQEKCVEEPYIAAPTRNEYLVRDPLWKLSFGAGAQTYFGEDDGKGDFKSRLTLAPTISISRRMSNIIGLRLQLTGGSLHGFNDGDSGFYTRWMGDRFYLPSDATKDPSWSYRGYKEGVDYKLISVPGFDGSRQSGWTAIDKLYMQHMRYVGLYGDMSVNLLNLIEGYKPRRTVEVELYAGIGLLQRFAHQGTLSGTFVAPSLGANVSYRVYDNFSLFSELRGSVVSDGFDGQIGNASSKFNYNGIGSLTFGVSYSFGAPKYIDPATDRRLAMPYNIAKAKDGMVLVPGGNIELGSGIDPVWGDSIPRKLVAVSPFWMDETEVTNAQYREFVYWVRDSLIRERLADPAYGGDPTYKVLAKNGEFSNTQRINWGRPIPWKNPTDREAAAIASVINGNSIEGVAAMNFKYDWFDTKSYYLSLAKLNESPTISTITISKDTAYVDARGNIIRETITRQSYGETVDFTNTYILDVNPDEFVWMTDFANAKNEQYLKNYFSQAAFDNYPVVGVSWNQADAFCAWRTIMLNENKPTHLEPYRLPTEAEWEFAARNGRSELHYSWLSNETQNSKGLAYTNYLGSKDLKDLISPAGSFLPNRFGLYDMSGNVAEWTTTSYTESTDVMADLVNPDYSYRAVDSDPLVLKRKIIKGGSWKDTKEEIRADMRSFEKQDKGRSYIGFRCVRSWGVNKNGKLN